MFVAASTETRETHFFNCSRSQIKAFSNTEIVPYQANIIVLMGPKNTASSIPVLGSVSHLQPKTHSSLMLLQCCPCTKLPFIQAEELTCHLIRWLLVVFGRWQPCLMLGARVARCGCRAGCSSLVWVKIDVWWMTWWCPCCLYTMRHATNHWQLFPLIWMKFCENSFDSFRILKI